LYRRTFIEALQEISNLGEKLGSRDPSCMGISSTRCFWGRNKLFQQKNIAWKPLGKFEKGLGVKRGASNCRKKVRTSQGEGGIMRKKESHVCGNSHAKKRKRSKREKSSFGSKSGIVGVRGDQK